MEQIKTCIRCAGRGRVKLLCTTCNGSGEGMHDGTRCRECNGIGRVWFDCPICDGLGEVYESDELINDNGE